MGRIFRGIASFSTLSFLLLVLASARSRKMRYHLNAMLYVFGACVCSSIGMVYAIFSSFIPGKRLHTNFVVARSFFYFTRPLIGLDVTIENEHYLQNRPAIMVGNHQSMVDTVYLGRMFPTSSIILGKKELLYVPFLGQFMWLGGNVFVDRKNRASAIKTMDSIGAYMRKNNLMMFIYPEGTRSHLATPDLLPFKKGAFHLAVQTQLPIIPVVCENYYRLYDSKTRFEGGRLRVAVLPPIETKGLTEQDVGPLSENVRKVMLDQLVAFDRELDQRDVDMTMHPSPTTQKPRLYGLAGLAARLIGTGNQTSYKRSLDKIAHNQTLSKGPAPSDYGLVSEGSHAKTA